MVQKDRLRKTYPSDLTDEQWAIVEPFIPPPKSSPRGGRPRQDDGVAAPTLLGLVTPYAFPRLVTICADQQDHNHALDAWMAEHRAGWRLEVKVRPAGTRGFTPLEKRWVIERTNAWHGRYRRNSKDYERSIESSTAMIQISNFTSYAEPTLSLRSPCVSLPQGGCLTYARRC